MHPLENFKLNLNEMANISGGDLGFFFPSISDMNSEYFTSQRKNIEQIIGKKISEEFWESFLIMNGGNFSSVYLSSTDDLIRDNRDFVRRYGRDDLPYFIVGHDVSRFYYLNLENDNFGFIEVDDIVTRETGVDISTSYKEFLEYVLSPYLSENIVNQEEIEEI